MFNPGELQSAMKLWAVIIAVAGWAAIELVLWLFSFIKIDIVL